MGGQSMGGMPGGGGGMMSENGQKMPLNLESFGQMSDGSTPSSEESADGASSTGLMGRLQIGQLIRLMVQRARVI